MAELAPEQKDVAARLFNHLVTPSGTKIAHEVSDLADFGQAPVEVVQPVLATLAERRILRSLEESGGVRYEIFHDVLAQPVLAWRAQHRTEREIERQLDGAAPAPLAAPAAAWRSGRGRSRNGGGRQRASRSSSARMRRSGRARRRREASTPPQSGSSRRTPSSSLLLASESARSSPSPTAEDALRRSLLTSQVREVHETGGAITDVAFARDGRHVAFTGDDGQARVVQSAGGRRVSATSGQVAESPLRRRGVALLRGRLDASALVVSRNGELSCQLGPASAADATTVGEFASSCETASGTCGA